MSHVLFPGPPHAPGMAWWLAFKACTLNPFWTANGSSTAATTNSAALTPACMFSCSYEIIKRTVCALKMIIQT